MLLHIMLSNLVKCLTYPCDYLVLTNLLEKITVQCALHEYYLLSLFVNISSFKYVFSTCIFFKLFETLKTRNKLFWKNICELGSS